MIITAYFSEGGAPKTGLSPTIDITDVSDGSLDIDNGAMTELANGWYKYDFSGADATKRYVWLVDGGSELVDPERYIEGEVNAVQVDAAAILGDTGTDGVLLASTAIDAIRTEPITDAETLETIGGMIHAIYCKVMQKKTVTNSAEVTYKLDDTNILRTQTLEDDDTTVIRSGG